MSSYVNKGLTSKQRRQKDADARIKSYSESLSKAKSKRSQEKYLAKIAGETEYSSESGTQAANEVFIANMTDADKVRAIEAAGGVVDGGKVVSFVKPEKDVSGKTPMDLYIEANKQKPQQSAAEKAQQAARENLRPIGMSVEEYRIKTGTAATTDYQTYRETEQNKQNTNLLDKERQKIIIDTSITGMVSKRLGLKEKITPEKERATQQYIMAAPIVDAMKKEQNKIIINTNDLFTPPKPATFITPSSSSLTGQQIAKNRTQDYTNYSIKPTNATNASILSSSLTKEWSKPYSYKITDEDIAIGKAPLLSYTNTEIFGKTIGVPTFSTAGLFSSWASPVKMDWNFVQDKTNPSLYRLEVSAIDNPRGKDIQKYGLYAVKKKEFMEKQWQIGQGTYKEDALDILPRIILPSLNLMPKEKYETMTTGYRKGIGLFVASKPEQVIAIPAMAAGFAYLGGLASASVVGATAVKTTGTIIGGFYATDVYKRYQSAENDFDKYAVLGEETLKVGLFGAGAASGSYNAALKVGTPADTLGLKIRKVKLGDDLKDVTLAFEYPKRTISKVLPSGKTKSYKMPIYSKTQESLLSTRNLFGSKEIISVYKSGIVKPSQIFTTPKLTASGQETYGSFNVVDNSWKVGKANLNYATGKEYSYLPQTSTEANILIRSIKSGATKVEGTYTLPDATKLLALTSAQSSMYMRDLPKTTSRLGEKGTEAVYKLVQQKKLKIFGSVSQQTQVAPEYIRLAGDFDLKVSGQSRNILATKFAKVISKAENIKTIANPKINGEVQQGSVYQLVNGKATHKLLEIKSSLFSTAQETAPAQFAGIQIDAKYLKGTTSTGQKIYIQQLGRQGVAKGSSIFTIRGTEGNTISFAPEPHRLKDFPDFFVVQKSLINSMTGNKASVASQLFTGVEGAYPKALTTPTELISFSMPKPSASPSLSLNFLLPSSSPSQPSLNLESPSLLPSSSPSLSLSIKPPKILPSKPSASPSLSINFNTISSLTGEYPIEKPSTYLLSKTSRSRGSPYPSPSPSPPSPYRPSPSPSPSPPSPYRPSPSPYISPPSPYPSPSPPSPSPSPNIVPSLTFGGGIGFFKGRGKSGRGSKSKMKYSPSLRGITLKLKAPKAFKSKRLTGFEIRGL